MHALLLPINAFKETMGMCKSFEAIESARRDDREEREQACRSALKFVGKQVFVLVPPLPSALHSPSLLSLFFVSFIFFFNFCLSFALHFFYSSHQYPLTYNTWFSLCTLLFLYCPFHHITQSLQYQIPTYSIICPRMY
ncbi:hypothetical protein ES288_A01G168100v1 [Gossypium darwinii]|uniref:Uncharacterized protein n=2 Tax=Gossypium TaxID=3633 RepID=A0A5D2RRN6_GOSTO|nr:hypothetical protein ES288_A01G168100v1 [Gossypium darwinii]TYI43517.1 hypothetical protein ES332_A01G175400v1 [Gossypium tomentosum]